MKKYFVTLSALLALTSVLVFAADIDGKWTRENQGKNGPTTQTLTLKSAGTKLTGSLDNGGGKAGPTEITDGTITGAAVSFKIVQDFGGNSVTTNYKGTVSATELKLTVEREGGAAGGKGGGGAKGPQEVVFKK
ncbi:MAG: hypothetical protein ABI811_03625 [Acidobacteriota bacterium]